MVVPTESELRVSELVLYLAGRPIPGQAVQSIGPERAIWSVATTEDGGVDSTLVANYRVVEFALSRNPVSRDAWAEVWRLVSSDQGDSVTVGVGPGGGPEYAVWNERAQARFVKQVAPLRSWGLVLVLLAGLVVWSFTLTREPGGGGAPRSLAKVVMWFWFWTIFASFLLIWLITGEFNGILTGQALILMGVQAATSSGSESINLHNLGGRATVSVHPAIGKRVPKTLHDLLADGSNAYRLHRMQNLIWHVTLAVIFIRHVYENLWMPEFDDTFLVLLGISNGLYLGLKISEIPKALVK